MLLFEIIQIAIGTCDRLTHIPSADEWASLYAEAIKQSVVGVALDGIQKLPREQWPPRDLILEWIGVGEQIKNQNRIANKRTVEVSELFTKAGFCHCILKGQGNARMYPNPYSRMSGDIDIWVCPITILDNPNEKIIRKAVNELVKKDFPDADEQDEHIEFPVFNDVPVEVHYKPGSLVSHRRDKLFANYYFGQIKEQMNNPVGLPQCVGTINVPTPEFNVVFQMMHMINHFLIEGIGLRHFVDYFYALCDYRGQHDKNNVGALFRKFGLTRFAQGVMWIEQECLGVEKNLLIEEPDERAGRMIMKEMLEGGNFGHYDERYKIRKKGYIARGLADGYRLLKLAFVFPSETMWKLYRKVVTQRWKLK